MINEVRVFMAACDQEVTQRSGRQIALYTGLQCEELAEKLGEILGEADPTVVKLHDLGNMFKKGYLDYAVNRANQVELLDADLDLIWVSIGAAISLGANVELGWDILTQSNMSKIDLATGKALKDQNGKVMKPSSYSPPEFGSAFP